jgi:hypothetical protein
MNLKNKITYFVLIVIGIIFTIGLGQKFKPQSPITWYSTIAIGTYDLLLILYFIRNYFKGKKDG